MLTPHVPRRVRRRRLLVEGPQVQLVLTLLTWSAAWIGVFVGLFVGPMVWQMRLGASDHEAVEAASALMASHGRVWLPLAVMFLGLTWVYLRETHRVAGPLYRFRKVFQQVASGDLSLIVKIRQRDYLQRESFELEEMVSALRARVRATRAVTARAQQEVLVLRSSEQPIAPDRLNALADCVDAIAASLDSWRTDRPEAGPASSVARPAPPLPDAGFSLVELLIVAAVISILSALAMPAYGRAIDRARITRATGDINAIGKELTIVSISRGCFPGSMKDLGRESMLDPWKHPYVVAVARRPGGGGRGGNSGSCRACADACVNIGAARKDKNLVPLNSDFDVYSLGKDGKSATGLTAATSRDDIIWARDGGFIGLASDY